MKKKFSCILFLLIFCIGVALAEPEQEQMLTNDTVVKMVNAGLSDDIILNAIAGNSAEFDTSPMALIELKKTNVSDAVITAMQGKSASGIQPKPESAPATTTLPNPDESYKWSGLELDVSTTKDVIAKLGDPVKDEHSGLEVFKIESRFPGLQSIVFHKFTFKPEAGRFREIRAYFKNDVLVVLHLRYRDDDQPEPLGLPSAFGNELEFKAMFSGWDEGFSPHDFERFNGDVNAINFPPDYAVTALAQRSVVNGVVKKPRLDLFTKDLGSKVLRKKDRGWPGKVRAVQLISRSLEPKATLAQN